MKKIISIFLLCVMLLSVAIAEDDVAGGVNTGNPYFNDAPDQYKGLFKPLTVFPGTNLVCDESATKSWNTAIPGSQVCFNNGAGKFPVVYQAFHYQQLDGRAGTGKIGDLFIAAGENKCLTNPRPGDVIYRQYFACDTEQTSCREAYPYYTAGCDLSKCGEGKVLRKRILTEVTPNGCSGWQSETCMNDDNSGFTCESVKPSTPVSPGTPAPGTPASGTSLKGEWQNIAIEPVTKPGEEVKANVRFVALASGKYYLEAGILPKFWAPLATVVSQGSKCDGKKNFAGGYFDLAKDEHIDLEFRFLAIDDAGLPLKEGKYPVLLGAYTGCLADGGEKVNTLSQTASIASNPAQAEGGREAGNNNMVWIIVGIIIIIVVVGVILFLIL